jgi:hypothetical protein
MPRGKASPKPDHTTLQMALVGYEIEKERIAGKIRDIKSQLGAEKPAGGGSAKGEAAPKKRVLPPLKRNAGPNIAREWPRVRPSHIRRLPACGPATIWERSLR